MSGLGSEVGASAMAGTANWGGLEKLVAGVEEEFAFDGRAGAGVGIEAASFIA